MDRLLLWKKSPRFWTNCGHLDSRSQIQEVISLKRRLACGGLGGSMGARFPAAGDAAAAIGAATFVEAVGEDAVPISLNQKRVAAGAARIAGAAVNIAF